MSSSSINDKTLQQLGNEFKERVRRGEQPTVEEYANRYSGDDAKRVTEYLKGKKKTKPSSSATQAGAAIPKQFGRYQIERTLGEGGMGAVYLAHDSQLDRKVALKTPKFSSDSDPTMMQRFYREARSAATLQHPNICPVYDVGEINGTHYISMAYIEGRPLSDLVQAEKQPTIASLLRVVRKIAIALHEAHSQGLIHRDLKPANIMIDRRNEPIVMDFGLARQFGNEESDQAAESAIAPDALATSQKVEARITIPGTVMGSPGYMAPEQLQGDPSAIGPASDVYAMGVLLFELLTGQLPFPGTGTLMSVVNAVISEPPPDATTVRSNLDPKVAAVCRKAMSKKVGERYESMQTFALAISRLLKSDTEGNRATAKASATTSPELVRTKEQFELARTLFQEGQFAGAVSIMEKMVAVDQTPNQHVNQYSKWAQETLPNARAKAEETQLLGFADDGPLADDLWNAVDESTLPPKRKRNKSRRKKKTKSLTYTFFAGAAGAIAVLLAAMAIQNTLQEQDGNRDPSGADKESEKAIAVDASNENESITASIDEPEKVDSDEPETEDGDLADDRSDRLRAGRRNPIKERLVALDENEDKKLSRQEVESGTAGPRNGMIKRLSDRFDEFDKNGDGVLGQVELEYVIEQLSREFEGRQQRGPKRPKP